jgi:hypothetical protein
VAELAKEELVVKEVVVLVDRQQGAREGLAAKGFRLHSVLTVSKLLTIRKYEIQEHNTFIHILIFLDHSTDRNPTGRKSVGPENGGHNSQFPQKQHYRPSRGGEGGEAAVRRKK